MTARAGSIVRADSLRPGARFVDKFGREVWTVIEGSGSGCVWVVRERDGHKTCFAGCADAELVP